jgi:hypothetical protein
VIFLSVTYARAADGRLRYNFGPLNGENGWRAAQRADDPRAPADAPCSRRCAGDEIHGAATTSRGAQLLREFLLYAEHGRLEGGGGPATGLTRPAPFERDVHRRAHRARPDGRAAGSGPRATASTLAVLDDAAPGRFLCGIECDGAAYHRAETARDRDRLRQQVLEARGWTIHRVWSTDWFKDRPGQIARLLGLVEAARAEAREAREADAAARARVLADAAARAAADLEERGPRGRRRAPGRLGRRARGPGRPVCPPRGRGVHRDARRGPLRAGGDLLAAPAGQLAAAVRAVVDAEGPVHEAELAARVAGFWGTRVGARIQARIAEACRAAERDGAVVRRGTFLWRPGAEVRPRSRAAARMAADRIAAEEYAATVRAVLATGHGFSRPQLTTEVRAVLGFSRTGALSKRRSGRPSMG